MMFSTPKKHMDIYIIVLCEGEIRREAKRTEENLKKSSKPSLYGCQTYHSATFCQGKRKSRGDQIEPEKTNNYRASKGRIISKERTTEDEGWPKIGRECRAVSRLSEVQGGKE